jgi:DNA replication protein DnaC
MTRRSLDEADFRRMNFPEAYWRVKLQGVNKPVRAKVSRYIQHIDQRLADGVGLIIGGKPGVGKTGIAALIGKVARLHRHTVFFSALWELREHIRERIMFEHDTSVLDRCRNVDLLILDGLCEDDAKDYYFGTRTLLAMLSLRSARKRPTIMTTQLGVADIRKYFPGLLEAVQGSMVYFPVSGANLRQSRHEALVKDVLGD